MEAEIHIMRLVTVSFPLPCSMHFAEIIHVATVSALMVSRAMRKIIQISWFLPQLQHPHYLFGITYLHSEWRLIWFGNPSGISWRGCISFNATCHLSIPSGSFSIVSLMLLYLLFLIIFLGQTGANLTRTGCRNIFFASGGSWNWPLIHWHEARACFAESSINDSRNWCIRE